MNCWAENSEACRWFSSYIRSTAPALHTISDYFIICYQLIALLLLFLLLPSLHSGDTGGGSYRTLLVSPTLWPAP